MKQAGKKILVYLYFFKPFENANTNAVMPVIKALAKTHSVTVYASQVDRSVPMEEDVDGLHTVRFRECIPHLRIRLLTTHFRSLRETPLPLKPLVFLLNRNIVYRALDGLCRAFLSPSQRKLTRLLVQGGYDMLVTVSSPITPQLDALALAQRGVFLKFGVRWVPYVTDPCATFIGYRTLLTTLMPIECDIYQRADAVITTPELYADNSKYPLSAYLSKTRPVPLSNLKPTPDTEPVDFLLPGKINCLYVGSLFCIDVRDPSYFYRIAACCPDDFAFHIVCYDADTPNRMLKKEFLTGLPNVYWHERAPLPLCLSAMCGAQVLINLGNKCENQTPSKVFDYMGAGKPIVNFYDIDADTSMRYLERYPMKLHIRNKPLADASDVQEFVSFCRTYAGKTIPFSEVRALYADITTEACAAQFVENIEEILARPK